MVILHSKYGKILIWDVSFCDQFILLSTSEFVIRRLGDVFNMFGYNTQLHGDITFKMWKVGHNTLTLSVTDVNRVFHLIGLAIMCHRTEGAHRDVMKLMGSTCRRFLGQNFFPEKIKSMGDADKAQQSRWQELSPTIEWTNGICWFHLIYNVRKNKKT